MLGQPGDAFLGLALPFATLEAEGLGHDAHGEGAAFLGHLGHDRRGAGAGAAAHAGGNEHQVGPLQGLQQVVARFLGGLLADHRISPSPETASELLTQLDALLRRRLQQGLGIRVEHPVAHPLKIRLDHAVHGIAAPSPHTDHLDPGRLAGNDAIAARHGLAHRCGLLGLRLRGQWIDGAGSGGVQSVCGTELAWIDGLGGGTRWAGAVDLRLHYVVGWNGQRLRSSVPWKRPGRNILCGLARWAPYWPPRGRTAVAGPGSVTGLRPVRLSSGWSGSLRSTIWGRRPRRSAGRVALRWAATARRRSS